MALSAYALAGALLVLSPASAQDLVGSPPGRSSGVQERRRLERTWLRYGQEVSARAFEVLIDVARQDPEAMAVVNGAVARLGVRTPGDLRRIFRLCHERRSIVIGGPQPARAENELMDFESGHYERTVTPWPIPRTSAEPGALPENVREAIGQGISHRREDLPSHVIVFVENEPKICIGEGMSVAESYLTMIHELEHFRSDDPFERPDLLAFGSPDDFARAALIGPGGEFMAFTAHGGALKRLLTRLPGLEIRDSVSTFFDDAGRLVDPEGLKEHILGIGYRRRFHSDFSRMLVDRHNQNANLFDRLVAFRNTAAHNHNVYAKNEGIYRRRAEQLRRTGASAERIREAEQQAERARKNKEFTRQYVRDVEAECERLRAENVRLSDAIARHFPPQPESGGRGVIVIGGESDGADFVEDNADEESAWDDPTSEAGDDWSFNRL